MPDLAPPLDIRLAVKGDLQFRVDGPAGSTAGTVTGRGDTVAVHADDPVAAWDAALGSPAVGPAVLQAVAGLLHDQGVLVAVRGPAGLVAEVGAGVDSRVGRLLTGSRRVRLGAPAAVRPLAVAQARRTLRRSARAVRRPAAVLVLAGTLLVGARLRTLRRHAR